MKRFALVLALLASTQAGAEELLCFKGGPRVATTIDRLAAAAKAGGFTIIAHAAAGGQRLRHDPAPGGGRNRNPRGHHSFRATGITAYLKACGTLENAAAMANHASTRTAQLYDRRQDAISLDEVKRIRL